MNTPNKLTLLRVTLVPIFITFLMIESIPYNYVYALILFVVASLTDLLDGHLARKNNQITTFGKFLDPIADKILVLSAMLCFIELGLSSSIAVIIIITREFMVTSLRLIVVSSDGKVIPNYVVDISLVSNILMWIAAAITVVSGVEYIAKNKDAIDTTK